MTATFSRSVLFSIEGVWAFVFISLSYLLISMPLRVFTCAMNHDRLASDKLPTATQALQFIFPEHPWSWIGFVVGCSLGFAWIASVCQEALSSRCFRWFLALLALALTASAVPLLELHTCLCYSDYDSSWLDEVICFLAGMAACFLGRRYAVSRSKQSA